MFIVCLILFICIVVAIYWNYFRPRQYKTIYKKLLQFAGFKYSHLTAEGTTEGTNQELRLAKDFKDSHNNNNSHFIIYGSSGSGKTSFLKYYLSQSTKLQNSSYVVFGRDEREFPSQNFVPLLQLENISIEQLVNKVVILDDAGAYKCLKTKVEDLFRYGRHHNLQIIYLAHYSKDVLPVVRENCHKVYSTINNPDNFFESIMQTYSIKELVWKYYHDQFEYGIIEFDTRSQKYRVLNHKYD